MGSPLYAALLEAAADDIADRGITADLVDGWEGDARIDALPLRVMGAMHHLALTGAAPALAEGPRPGDPADI